MKNPHSLFASAALALAGSLVPTTYTAHAFWTVKDPAARANRLRLKHLMEARGFRNYPREWWHYGFAAGAKATIYDVPIAP